MRISLSVPIVVTTDEGTVSCTSGEVSVAVSNSVAIRVVPVDANGTEYPDSAVGVVGSDDQSDIATFLASVADATSVLLTERGV